ESNNSTTWRRLIAGRRADYRPVAGGRRQTTGQPQRHRAGRAFHAGRIPAGLHRQKLPHWHRGQPEVRRQHPGHQRAGHGGVLRRDREGDPASGRTRLFVAQAGRIHRESNEPGRRIPAEAGAV
ncbi:MAG: hypothetical protein AVDCRST_MAG56-3356, partial [uncultured Cytophagales bacterium]